MARKTGKNSILYGRNRYYSRYFNLLSKINTHHCVLHYHRIFQRFEFKQHFCTYTWLQSTQTSSIFKAFTPRYKITTTSTCMQNAQRKFEISPWFEPWKIIASNIHLLQQTTLREVLTLRETVLSLPELTFEPFVTRNGNAKVADSQSANAASDEGKLFRSEFDKFRTFVCI